MSVAYGFNTPYRLWHAEAGLLVHGLRTQDISPGKGKKIRILPAAGFELGPGEGTKITKRHLYLCAISPHTT